MMICESGVLGSSAGWRESLQVAIGYFRRVFFEGGLSRSGLVECMHLDTVDKQIATDKVLSWS